MTDRPARIATDSSGLLLGDLEIGSRIGPFRLEARLPARGHGLVYAASHAKLQRSVMVRIMPATYGSPTSIAAELARAAQIIETLDHPGIPRVLACDALADGRPWIATDLIEGATLANVIAEWPLTAEEALAVIRDVAAILEHAHGRGLVHTSLVPSAIVMPDVAMQFPLTVTDWGLARTAHSASPLPFRTSTRGRPYLAPEQLRGEEVTAAADVFALGVIAYQAVTGELPMTPRAELPDHLPRAVMLLIEQMLERDPARRPTSAQVRAAATRIAATLGNELARGTGSTRVVEAPAPSRAITSERFSQVAGEIKVASTRVVARIRLARVAIPMPVR